MQITKTAKETQARQELGWDSCIEPPAHPGGKVLDINLQGNTAGQIPNNQENMINDMNDISV